VSAVATVATVALGAVFVIAGAAKVAIGRSWPEQARGMGVSVAMARVVPWWELAVGACCVVMVWRPMPALAAVLTLVAMTALIVRLLLLGRRPACACFGAWSAAPLGWQHVARNAVLIAIGLVAVFAA
jgi:uncharacterized membrane protein YphA (DoxX/SURF4 family)